MIKRRPKSWRSIWRPLLAYAVVFAAVLLVLLNLVTDARVTRYDANAPSNPDSGFLEGMTPRQLGDSESKRAVLFVHGFVGAQSNFNDLPDRVAETGWYVETMRLPGHGTSPRDFERTSADELVAGVRDQVERLNQEYDTVVIVAHSLGGALATIVAADTPVDGLVLCAPFFGLAWDNVLGVDSAWLIRRAALFVRWFPGRPGNGPVADPEGRKHIDCYGWIPMAGAVTALEIGDRAREGAVLRSLSMPVLAIHSRADSVTSRDATAEALESLSSETVETCWLERSDHVIFWDYEQDIVREAVLNFLKEVCAS